MMAGRAAVAAGGRSDCPDSTVRDFGVEPYDTAARLVPIYQKVGELIGKQLGCPVQVFVATNYNAEIEAMRDGKLEIGEFGPLGYVLAHQVAKAEAVAAFGTADGKPGTYWASIVTYSGSASRRWLRSRGTASRFPTQPRPPAICSRLTGCD